MVNLVVIYGRSCFQLLWRRRRLLQHLRRYIMKFEPLWGEDTLGGKSGCKLIDRVNDRRWNHKLLNHPIRPPISLSHSPCMTMRTNKQTKAANKTNKQTKKDKEEIKQKTDAQSASFSLPMPQDGKNCFMQVQHCLCFHGTVALWRHREVSSRQFDNLHFLPETVAQWFGQSGCNASCTIHKLPFLENTGLPTTKRRIETPAIHALPSDSQSGIGVCEHLGLGWLLVQHCHVHLCWNQGKLMLWQLFCYSQNTVWLKIGKKYNDVETVCWR